MTAEQVVRVTGTDDASEIAAALTAVFAAVSPGPVPPSGYERWREVRISALRRGRRPGGHLPV